MKSLIYTSKVISRSILGHSETHFTPWSWQAERHLIYVLYCTFWNIPRQKNKKKKKKKILLSFSKIAVTPDFN